MNLLHYTYDELRSTYIVLQGYITYLETKHPNGYWDDLDGIQSLYETVEAELNRRTMGNTGSRMTPLVITTERNAR